MMKPQITTIDHANGTQETRDMTDAEIVEIRKTFPTAFTEEDAPE